MATGVATSSVGPPSGLSPRVRGSLDAASPHGRNRGSIPACAGKPPSRTRARLPDRVYPRVCGEAELAHLGWADVEGLSPRVRGSPDQAQRVHDVVGSIPACAGKPVSRPGRLPARRVYPRVCGEAFGDDLGVYVEPGLSPRVRGSHRADYLRVSRSGSIPACAGKPPAAKMTSRCFGVYPRVCGEAPGQARRAVMRWGLSPRVRGSPSSLSSSSASWRVYSRVCGEAPVASALNKLHKGLSPRVRGSPPHPCQGSLA